MKKLYLLVLSLCLGVFVQSQTVVYQEDFESTPNVAVYGSPVWAVSTTLYNNGLQSDSCRVALNSVSYLATDTFSTSGNPYVMVEFTHICKIESADSAVIEVSTDNGATWVLLNSGSYLGASTQYVNRFSSASYTDWLNGDTVTLPTNSWWKTEQFNISTLAGNKTQVIVRFKLADGNGNGAKGCYGWLIDDITVTASPAELIPPVISLISPIYTGNVYHLGPFDIYATITDASGIDTAKLTYTINGGASNTIGMYNIGGNTYYCKIDTVPVFSYNDTICYYIVAVDASTSSNAKRHPNQSCYSFILLNPTPPSNCGTTISTFPFVETFDNFPLPTTSSTHCGDTIPLTSDWINVKGDDIDWVPNTGTTPAGASGPDQDHTTGSGIYLFLEPTLCYTKQAYLTTPCINISKLSNPTLEFWYHMYGSTMGELHVDIFYGGAWVNDIMPAFIGQQQTAGQPWKKAEVNLRYYKGIVKIRFRGITGQANSDMAIDDVKIWEPLENDAGIVSIDAPSFPFLPQNQDVKVTVKNFGSQNLTAVDINWMVNGVPQTPYNWSGLLFSNNVDDSVTIGNYAFSKGVSVIKAWTENPNGYSDVSNNNDTTELILCTGPLKGTYTIGGVSPDFTDFTEAVLALKYCGIDSSVVFNVASGTYNEQIAIPSVNGVSATKTVTFQSAAGDSTAVILSYASKAADKNYVIKLDSNSSYITFKNMTISATDTIYARVVVFYYANHIQFLNNVIQGYTTTMTNNRYAVIYSSTSIDEYNTIKNNRILNGSQGILCVGVPSNFEYGNIIKGNYIIDFYEKGIYIEQQDSIQITDNVIENSVLSGNAYGIDAYICKKKLRILKNRIHVHGTLENNGMKLFGVEGDSLNPMLVANNFITQSGATNSYVFGIQLYNSSWTNLYYNSVNIAGGDTIGRAIYCEQNSIPLVPGRNSLVNNNFINTGGGYAICIGFGASYQYLKTCDYNNYYVTGKFMGMFNWPTISTERASTISSWPTVSQGLDYNSKSINPVFNTSTDLHINATSLNYATPLSIISDDIDGQSRNATKPYVGADEYMPVPIDIGAFALISPASEKCFSSSETIIVRVKNFGTNNINFSVTPAVLQVNITGATNPNPTAYTHNITTGTILSGSYLDITVATNYNMSGSGTYKFDAYTTLSGDGNSFNNTMSSQNIIVYGIQNTPFTENFETFVVGSPGTLDNGWTTNPSVGYRWQVNSGPTATTYTGPNTDHTYGTIAGVYLYTEATDGANGDTAYLMTPCINLSGLTTPLLKFWYHMYGTDITALRIDVYSGGGWTNNVHVITGQQQTSETDAWKQATVNLSAFAGNIVRVRFRAIRGLGAMGRGDIAIDDINLREPCPYDVGVNAFLKPVKCYERVGNSIQIQVSIENYGLNTVTSMNIGYKAGSSSAVIIPWSGSLVSGGITTYQFTTSYMVTSSGDFDICAFTDLTSDCDHNNDTSCIDFVGMALVTVPWNDNFDGTTNYWGTGCGTPQWEHGIPTASTIASAYSPPNAWKTNLDGDYKANSDEYLYSPFFDFSNAYYPRISFYHWIHSEASQDGGTVQYSIDGGNTWINLGYLGSSWGANWYNSMIGGSPAWTGLKTGWEYSYYDLVNGTNNTITNKFPNPVQFRFKFTSNASNHYNGWAIDDFAITLHPVPCDPGVTAILQPAGPTKPGNAVGIEIRIKNFGTDTLYTIPVKYKVGNNSPVQETWTGTLYPDSTDNYNFTQTFISPSAAYKLCAYTAMICDTNNYNDTTCVNMAIDGIGEIGNNIFTLGQNIPNPANGKTIIPYIIPSAGNVKFEVINIVGQVVYSENINTIAGIHQFEVDVKDMHQGLYYYAVEFNSKKLVKKMIIN